MDYYKVCSEDPFYKFGLNIWGNEFNDDPTMEYSGYDCGGIHFTSFGILSFLDSGDVLRKVEIPQGARVVEVKGYPGLFRTDKVILGKKEKLTYSRIVKLVEEGADPNISGFYPFQWAVRSGRSDLVKFFSKFGVTPSYHGYLPLCVAVRADNVYALKLLFELGNISKDIIEKVMVRLAGGECEKAVKFLELKLAEC